MAVDPRNGRRLELSESTLKKFALPRRDPQWLAETRKAWNALWADPVAVLLSPVDRPVLLRWADATDRYLRFLAAADLAPVATGSMGQPVENPLYGIADKAYRTARDCEAQLGVGALHRARLGLETAQAQKTLADLNAKYGPAMEDDADDDPDPRAIPGTIVG